MSTSLCEESTHTLTRLTLHMYLHRSIAAFAEELDNLELDQQLTLLIIAYRWPHGIVWLCTIGVCCAWIYVGLVGLWSLSGVVPWYLANLQVSVHGT